MKHVKKKNKIRALERAKRAPLKKKKLKKPVSKKRKLVKKKPGPIKKAKKKIKTNIVKKKKAVKVKEKAQTKVPKAIAKKTKAKEIEKTKLEQEQGKKRKVKSTQAKKIDNKQDAFKDGSSIDPVILIDLNLPIEEVTTFSPVVDEPAKKKRGRPRKIISVAKLISFPEVIGASPSASEMLDSFFSEYPGIGTLTEGVKSSFLSTDMELVLSKLMNIVDQAGAINIPYERYLVQVTKSSEDISNVSLNLGNQKAQFVDMLDRGIYRSVAERFVESINEKIDPSQANQKNKVYTAKWTNRIAMWRFFERYGVPISNSHSEDTADFLQYHTRKFSEFYDDYPRSKIVSPINPFHQYGHAFAVIMNAWMPCIKKVIKMFVTNTRGGADLQDDFMSISQIAFLHALEKQAMAMLGNAKVAQGIPFPKRLEYAVRKLINSDLPDLTGPVRVPVESKDRKKMPVGISLDSWYDDNDY